MLLTRILFFLLSLSLTASVIYFVEPPTSWMSATIFQILLIYIPILLTFTTFTNIFLRFLPKAFILGLGFIVATVFLSVQQLNLISGLLILGFTLVCTYLFPKFEYSIPLPYTKKSLTTEEKIPKLRIHQAQKELKSHIRRFK